MDSTDSGASSSPHADYSIATLSIHADDQLNKVTDVAPPIHVSTTFRYNHDPDNLVPVGDEDISSKDHPPVYSRLAAPNTTRFEAILSSLLDAHAITYASGLAAFHALLVFVNPKRIAIGEGYHGCHGVISIHAKLNGLQKVDLFDEDSWDRAGLGPGDLVHLETPLNPTGQAFEIRSFAEKAHKRGALLSVDATFAPPGLGQDPFAWGADVVMHSGTKYVGGHSDLLCGLLAVKKEEMWWGLWKERMYLGNVMGSLEGWLGVRSLRTVELRVQRQSRNAESLVSWLDGLMSGAGDREAADTVAKAVSRIQHASLQKEDMSWLKRQMPHGFGPVFALWMKKPEMAKALPSKLKLFHHATSLGGVESLIEWRRMSDAGVDSTLLRVSVGIESWEDLRDDMLAGFKAVVKEHA